MPCIKGVVQVKGKRFLSIMTALLMTLSMLTMLSVVPQAADYKNIGDLQFAEDGTFKILQITDLQHNRAIPEEPSKFIHALILEAQPDLIVLTGDNVIGGLLGDNNYEVKIRSFMDIFEHYGIPVAVVFGNHDSSSGKKADQLKIYKDYDVCLMEDRMTGTYYDGYIGTAIESSRVGNYNIPVRSSDGENPYAYNLWFFDTGEGTGFLSRTYEGVTTSTLEWYNYKEKALKKLNGEKTVPSLVFQHIAVPEVNSSGLDSKTNTTNNTYPYEYNYKNESPCPTDSTHYRNQVDAHFAVGDVKAIFFGHDHANHYRATYTKNGKSIDFVNTGLAGEGSSSDLSYNGIYHCGRLITIDEKNPNAVKTETFVIKGSTPPKDPNGSGDLTAKIDSYTSADLKHSSMTAWQGIEATCIMPAGSESRTCASRLCPYTETREGSGAYAACKPGAYQTELAPTCTEDGKEARYCTVCGKFCDERDIPADGITHEVAADWVETLAPTCSAQGTKVKKCIRCEAVLETESIPIEGDKHSPDQWVITTPSTCSALGVQQLRCALCSEYYDTDDVALDPAVHNPGDFVTTLAATCLAAGESQKRCKDCNALLDTQVLPIDSSAHTALAWRTIAAASCSVEGSEEQYCAGCGVVTIDHRVIAKNNKHTAGDWVILTVPTCGTTGLRSKLCVDCGMTLEAQGMVKDPTNHAAGDWVTVTASTCSTKGSSELRCLCKNTVLDTREEALDPENHIPGGAWTVVTAPSCTAEGLEVQHCAGASCSAVLQSAAIDKTPHQEGSWRTAKEPTCAALGEEELPCAVCGTRMEAAPLAMKEHSAGEWVLALGANCAKEGRMELRCADCGAVMDTKSLEKTAHTPGNWRQTLAPTCVKAGAAEQRCLGCNTVVDTKVVEIDPAAHSFGDWVVTTKPTASAFGVETRTCTRCQATETRQAAKLQSAPEISGPATVPYLGKIQLQADQSVLWGGGSDAVKVHPDGTVESLKAFNKTSSVQVSATGNGKTTYYTVKVSPSFGQWMMIIFLFGWIWL